MLITILNFERTHSKIVPVLCEGLVLTSKIKMHDGN